MSLLWNPIKLYQQFIYKKNPTELKSTIYIFRLLYFKPNIQFVNLLIFYYLPEEGDFNQGKA